MILKNGTQQTSIYYDNTLVQTRAIFLVVAEGG